MIHTGYLIVFHSSLSFLDFRRAFSWANLRLDRLLERRHFLSLAPVRLFPVVTEVLLMLRRVHVLQVVARVRLGPKVAVLGVVLIAVLVAAPISIVLLLLSIAVVRVLLCGTARVLVAWAAAVGVLLIRVDTAAGGHVSVYKSRVAHLAFIAWNRWVPLAALARIILAIHGIERADLCGGGPD